MNDDTKSVNSSAADDGEAPQDQADRPPRSGRRGTPPRRESGPEATTELTQLELETAFDLSKRVLQEDMPRKRGAPPLPFAYKLQDEEDREKEREEEERAKKGK